MRHLLVGLALAIGPLAASVAAAQDTPPPPPPAGTPTPDQLPHDPGRMGGRGMMGGRGAGGLMAADANGDGIVTREEVIAAADARFAAADTNHDGQLSPDEMAAAMPGRGVRGGGTAGGAPGPVTPQQFHDRALRPFDRVDANHDGRIDATEMANWREQMRERREAREGGGGGQ